MGYPCEQVLNVPIVCWRYGPSKSSSLSLIEAWLKPTTSLVSLREKLGTDPQIDRSVCWGLCREPLFGSSEIYLSLSVTHERLLCLDHVRFVLSGTIRGLSVGCVLRVCRVFPCRVYIDSNRCDSRIWVPLVCGSHHVDNLMNLMSLSVIDMCCLLHLIACNSYLSRVGCNLFQNVMARAKKNLRLRTHS
jgi:hypothetical protein